MIYENSVRNFLDHDFIIVHDPQPLPLIEHYEKNARHQTVSRSVRRAVVRSCSRAALCAVSNGESRRRGRQAEQPSYNIYETTPNVSRPVRVAVRRAL